MDPSKAKIVMKLLSSKNSLERGLRELKKRLLDSSNISVFRKLKLVVALLKIVEEHGSNSVEESCKDACTNEDSAQLTTEEKKDPSVEAMDVQELEFEDLQRLRDLNHSSEVDEGETKYSFLPKVDKVDPKSEQILLYAVSLLCTMLQDHGAKLQCEGLQGVQIVMPFITCNSVMIAERAIKTTAYMVELPGSNRDMFIRFRGPQLLLSQLLKPNFEDVSFQKALLTALRIVSCSEACNQAVLRHQGLETVCMVGLSSAPLQPAAIALIATYSSLQQQEALVQLLDGTKELSLLLSVWQDNRDSATIHTSTLRVLVNLVQLALRGSEPLQGSARHPWLIGGSRREEGGRDPDYRGNAGLTALRLRLLKAFFAIKTAIPLVTEIANYEGVAGEKIISALCTLCDGSLELQSSPSGRSNLALVWLQVVEAGGIKPFVRLLLKGIDYESDASKSDQKETSSVARLQKKILRAMVALENNHGIQEIVFKHCLASGILPALTLHFDAAFTRYQNCRGLYTEGSLCPHQQVTRTIAKEDKSTCGKDSAVLSQANARKQQHQLPGLRRSMSTCNVSESWKNSSDNRPLSPPLTHPLAPLSPPSSPQEAPKFVYTPYSPPQKKFVQARSACTSPQFYTARSPSASPPHFPSYSPIKPGCVSPSFAGGWSSPSCSPSYSPSHSPSYTPPSNSSSYSPSHSPTRSSMCCYSPSRSPINSPSSPSSPRLPSKRPRSPGSQSSSSGKDNPAFHKQSSAKESDRRPPKKKRNKSPSDDLTDEDSKKFKVIRLSSPDSSPVSDSLEDRSDSDEIISTFENSEDKRLTEMVLEKLPRSHTKQSFRAQIVSDISQENVEKTGPNLQLCKDDSDESDVKCGESLDLKISGSEETLSQIALDSRDSRISSATQNVGINHIDIRAGRNGAEHTLAEEKINSTSVRLIVSKTETIEKKHKSNLNYDKHNTDQLCKVPVCSGTVLENSNTETDHKKLGHSPGAIKSIFDENEPTVVATSMSKSLSKCLALDNVVSDQRNRNASSLEEDLPKMEVDESESKDVPTHVASKPFIENGESQAPRMSEQRPNSVHVREFNHIKFRVGKRAKVQPKAEPSDRVAGPVQKQDEARSFCSKDTAFKQFSGQAGSNVSREARKPVSHECSEKGDKSSIEDPVRDCESKLSSCRLSRSEGASSAQDCAQQEAALEESLRHLELVVRIITQVCQIREALSGVCREFLPRVMLYLRHAHRLHASASRFLSTISQTPCSIQGLLDTFFPAYVAVQLCESLVVSGNKRTACDCGFCNRSKSFSSLSCTCPSNPNSACQNIRTDPSNSSCSPSNNHKPLFEARSNSSEIKKEFDPVAGRSKTTDCQEENSKNSEASCKNSRCSLQNSVCNECAMLVTGGQSFLLNMSKFFGHVHRYGSQEAANRLRPNTPACVRETCSLNIPHIARCPSQLQQLMLNGGGLQDIFSILREDEPPSTVRYIYAAAALHALAKATDITSQVTLGKGCSLCLISAAQDATDAVKDCAGNLREEGQNFSGNKAASKNSSAFHGKCFWLEQVDHDVTLVCSATDGNDFMQHQDIWNHMQDEYSEEELTDNDVFDDDDADDEGPTSDASSTRETHLKPEDKVFSKTKAFEDSTSTNVRPNESGGNSCSAQKSDIGIRAHRSVLCEASEVWAVMLGDQGWREATDGVIRVGGLGQHALAAIVHHLYGCTCTALSSLTVHEYVELLHACHMYGLKQLQAFAAHRIVQTCSSASDLLTVYHASAGLVDKEVITSLLVHLVACRNVRSWRRAQWLHTLAHSPSGEQLLSDIHGFLFHKLQANRNTCTCDASQSLYMTSNSVYSKLI